MKKEKIKYIFLWCCVIFLGIIFIGILFDKVIMKKYVRSGAYEKIPNVVGMKFEEAEGFLRDRGFSPYIAEERFDQRYPKGSVVLQNPFADAIVKPGRRVYLIISSGEQKVEVPSIRGRSLREAVFALEREGLTVGAISYEASSLYPENTVIEQGIISGEEAPRGSAINLVVSRGSEEDKVMAPELVGKTLSEAQRLLSQRGLRIGNVTYQPIPDLLPNTVVQQYPHPGDLIPRNQKVDVFVAQEPKEDTEEIIEGGGGGTIEER